jgi:hypothetical protein
MLFAVCYSCVLSDAEKPEEWDDEEDGDWIAPTVHNPKCEEAPGCGEWKRYALCFSSIIHDMLMLALSAPTSPTPSTRASGMPL